MGRRRHKPESPTLTLRDFKTQRVLTPDAATQLEEALGHLDKLRAYERITEETISKEVIL